MPLRPALLAAAAALCLGGPAFAQDANTPPRDGGPLVQAGDTIEFSADNLSYDDSGEIALATGDVRMNRDEYKLQADSVEYNRKTGVVTAHGHVIATDPQGNQTFGDRVVLDDALRDGVADNMLLVLADGGRLAANSGERRNGTTTLNRAVFSPCPVVDGDGCPKTPIWQIKALRIISDPGKHRIRYKDATLEMFGVPILYLPGVSHPDALADRVGGLLFPQVTLRRSLGLGVSLPFHFPIASDRDFTVTPWLYTSASPALALQARRLFKSGPVEADAFFTYTKLTEFAADGSTEIDRGRRFRGYFGFKGQLQHSPEWRSTFSLRLTTDDTFNRRYGLDYDDTLRSTYALERFRQDSYLSISIWGFQGLRATDRGGEIPFALPLIDYDWRPQDELLGGRLRFGANSLNLYRTDGQDERRALAYGRWDRSFFTGLGQRITATAMLRGDLYNTSHPDLATLPEYAGTADFKGRVIPVVALDAELPLAGAALGGVQTFTPRIQLVASPRAVNNGIPNEDSRSIELEDVSLFDLNRFPGYDRWEGGSRATYGLQYRLDRPHFSIESEIGQSARIGPRGDDFPAGTGLSGRFTDFTGRTTLKYGSLVSLTHRFRVDKSSFAVRRNEIDLDLGTRRTYLTIGYLKLNRNIVLEDLEDRTELRLGGRVAFARYWSAFGSAIIDLTGRGVNPTATGNGFQTVRHRVGVQYEDDCFRFGVSWRRDYLGDRDFRAGNSYQLSIAFKVRGL